MLGMVLVLLPSTAVYLLVNAAVPVPGIPELAGIATFFACILFFGSLQSWFERVVLGKDSRTAALVEPQFHDDEAQDDDPFCGDV